MKNKTEVLSLKYRPQTFEDLIGQDEISKTIYNSIKINKSSNAFLFSGIRGIGKTTFARIVAKALNCENGIENLCKKNFCFNCQSIIDSNHIDVLEMDAASNTGVDDVRELIEFSRYAPSVSKFKVFIIDEVHMLSKQAFNALLKTLEEPPQYLKFIFATTEIKKIPITVISRCQRYDLARVNSDQLFNHIKSIGIKEKKKIEDDAIKLIVKISEGSVRDALSLLDRALISINEETLKLNYVQKIFGYVDKSSYIDLLEYIFKGDEKTVLDHYRNLYNSGIEPDTFLNDFLEILYYIKNISYIQLQGKNFSLNDNDFKQILSLSKNLDSRDILLFWEYTLKTIKEIKLVSNPNLSIEMFLIQLMYIIKIYTKNKDETFNRKSSESHQNLELKNLKNNEPISQIKNIQQEEEKNKKINKETLNNLYDLIQLCADKKDMKLKYELENNVNIVSFSNKSIELSFNDKLNKNFVKDLSEKLYEWTEDRWIILFSKNKGEISVKEKQKNLKKNAIQEYKNSEEYSKIIKNFPDIEIIDIKNKND